jgi:hypothetical protein
MANSSRAAKQRYLMNAEGDIIAPSPERLAHGAVERLERPIPDGAGRVSRPYRNVDVLATMFRRGSITAAMRDAGEVFRGDFNRAHLEALRAGDVLRTPGRRGDPGLNAMDAREAVWRAILTVGGLASAGGSCLWGVLGSDLTLREWACTRGWNGRLVSQEAASGILVAALGTLEAHYFNGPLPRNLPPRAVM